MTFGRTIVSSCVLIATLAIGFATFAYGPIPRPGITLRGTGASFPYPIYTKWFRDFSDRENNIFVDYEMTSSGTGIRDFIGGTVDFAASDAAMDFREIVQVKRGAVLLPMTAGEIALVFNIPGVTALNLPRDAYIDIFRGEIDNWNDPRIAGANPHTELPDLKITVVTRSEDSGTTFIFTGHLAHISKDFSEAIGHGRKTSWPATANFRKAPGNQGVAALVKRTPGAIGYVEYGFARLVELPVAKLQNRAGNFVSPGTEAGTIALADVKFADRALPGSDVPDLVAWPWDPEAENAYPITSFTWLLLYADQEDKKAEALRQLLTYMVSDEAQRQATELGYVPLPEGVRARVRRAITFIQ
ncbi:phosphate transport system substrate-binding protein [Microbulbifer donghaiensis]|uniref:Phosphate-binding protein PstS n=1 Tax=Microbulbifer donghaiensis TaxID=494016 RepID=A0A1M4ZLP2_9GAMM|nr:phosphate ABC transporter substrate-binding protein PstS [Microbulbifer donghaiensis]SHF18722.1 phosphate transport system substrate-binding protein [Microbulbifer donghaiensis]